MRRLGRVAASLLLLGVTSGCGEEALQLSLRPGSTLDLASAPRCSRSDPSVTCPASVPNCADVHLASGVVREVCVPGDVCQHLQCSTGTCAVLESFPAQVTCVEVN